VGIHKGGRTLCCVVGTRCHAVTTKATFSREITGFTARYGVYIRPDIRCIYTVYIYGVYIRPDTVYIYGVYIRFKPTPVKKEVFTHCEF